MIACLCLALACGMDADDRMVRRYAKCMVDPESSLHRLTVSGAVGTVVLSSETAEKRLFAQLSREEVTVAKIRSEYARLLRVDAGENSRKVGGARTNRFGEIAESGLGE